MLSNDESEMAARWTPSFASSSIVSASSSSNTTTKQTAPFKWFVAAATADLETLNKFVKNSEESQTVQAMLFARDRLHGYTVLHWAIRTGRPETLRFVSQNLNRNQFHSLVQTTNNLLRTPIHLLAIYQRKNQAIIEEFANCLGCTNPAQLWEIVESVDIDGKRPIDYLIARTVSQIEPINRVPLTLFK